MNLTYLLRKMVHCSNASCGYASSPQDYVVEMHTHTHNRFTAGLEYVRVHPGQQVPEK